MRRRVHFHVMSLMDGKLIGRLNKLWPLSLQSKQSEGSNQTCVIVLVAHSGGERHLRLGSGSLAQHEDQQSFAPGLSRAPCAACRTSATTCLGGQQAAHVPQMLGCKRCLQAKQAGAHVDAGTCFVVLACTPQRSSSARLGTRATGGGL